MGPSATLLTYSGEGHGAILSSTCVDEAEAATIRDLTLPAAGTTCAPDPDVPRPAYWDQLPVPDGVGAPIDDPALAGALGLTPSQAYSGAWALTGDAQTVATEYQQALPSIGVQTADAGRQRRRRSSCRHCRPTAARWRWSSSRPMRWRATTPSPKCSQHVPAGQGLVLVLAYPPES